MILVERSISKTLHSYTFWARILCLITTNYMEIFFSLTGFSTYKNRVKNTEKNGSGNADTELWAWMVSFHNFILFDIGWLVQSQIFVQVLGGLWMCMFLRLCFMYLVKSNAASLGINHIWLMTAFYIKQLFFLVLLCKIMELKLPTVLPP